MSYVSIANVRRLVPLVIIAVAVLAGATIGSGPAFADAIRNREWIVGALHFDLAHRTSTGSGTTVAVIDTGVDPNQIDLRGRILEGTDLTSGVAERAGTTDLDGHGTGMAGLIAGRGHGSAANDGILGVAPDTKILPIRLLAHAQSNGGALSRAIDWAVAHGAKVICMAIAGPSSNPQDAAAMLRALEANVVLVGGAGNTTQGARTVEYPAAYPGVVAVAGTDEHGNHSKVSVTGKLITIAAPSDNIPSTYKDGGYAIGSGTSSATAIVAGAAALVRSRFPNLTASQVIDRLTETAIDKGPPGHDDEYGYGLLNIVGALTAKLPSATLSSGASAATSPTTSQPTTPANPTDSPVAAATARNAGTTIIVIVAAFAALVAAFLVWLYARRRTRPGWRRRSKETADTRRITGR